MPVQLQCPQQSKEQTELIEVYQVCGGVARDGGRKWGTSPEVHMSHPDHGVLYNPHTVSEWNRRCSPVVLNRQGFEQHLGFPSVMRAGH